MSFASLGLSEALATAVAAAGYAEPTPVQQRAIPAVLQGRDLMVAAQTGTGKTAGFALPVLERLFPNGHPDKTHQRRPRQARVLVLTPTRELAAQVHDSFKIYARDLPLASACIFGGVGLNPQVQALAKGLDLLVACPGRLLDLAGQGAVDLSHVETLVLDEADRMLDMGFIHDVKKVLALLPAQRQNLLFSATFSKDIVDLASRLLRDPERIEVTPPNTTVERIEQRVFRIPSGHKRALLAHLITAGAWEQVLVFTRTKHGANRLAEYLDKRGLPAVAIHGNKSQNARTKALADFKANAVRILVATDIAARGLDIDQLPHVVNFELPNVEEDYVHRIGRTGRAGRSGEAISLVAPDEEKLLKSIERMTKQKIPDGDLLGFDASTIEAEKPEVREPRQPRGQQKPQQKKAEGKSDDHQGGRKDKGKDKGRNKRRSKGKPEQAQSQAAAPGQPPLPPNRDPEEFLDDEIDNFGNRADYVSPYQKGDKRQGSGQRAGGQPRQGQGQAQGAGKRGQGQPGKGSSGGGQGRRQGQGQGSGQPRGNGGGGKRGGRRPEYKSLMSDAPLRPEGSAAPKPARQPVIMRKESRIDRSLTPEQLEQLESRNNRGGEKPALLTRNRAEAE
ncbi:DEAD/DEAH box helicase [Zestomonas carbonaria]|uniref:ATP-dependent RNA helicase RhlE n=1 Tax=Zestomonas carbonaria TaxID=2762745 RepID=A0A7U7I7S8_9GAMM|nr:DEAD/DEAH box helicase [Pseudomonas carbonaria]CAD5106421.1 ATP-dependent RNA helicase RhlE [Pseudomonas carbonaria]